VTREGQAREGRGAGRFGGRFRGRVTERGVGLGLRTGRPRTVSFKPVNRGPAKHGP